jgi:hypothetical protein
MPDYKIIEIWSHEWDHMVKTDPDVALFCSKLNLVEPLIPCEALLGGRTNALKLNHKCSENEKIIY